MDLMEYQAKELFAKHDVPVTLGTVITDPAEAAAAAEANGGRVVVKAQVKTGGRGKAGGVKLAPDPRTPWPRPARSWAWTSRATRCTGCSIAPAADIAEEYYFSFLVDRAHRNYLCIASIEGGVEIEVTAVENPDAVAQVGHRPARRRRRRQGGRDRGGHPLPGRGRRRRPWSVIKRLWDVFIKEDATLVEVNPLVRLADGRLEALDGKVSLDANADFRHAEHAGFEIRDEEDPLELAGAGEGPQLRQARRVPSASSATAPAWSCRPWTWWPTPASGTAA